MGEPRNVTKQYYDLEYLNHVIRNGMVNIQGCLREIEGIVTGLNKAVAEYGNDYREHYEKQDPYP